MFKKRSESKNIRQMSATVASLQGRTSEQLPRATRSRDYITPDDAQSACFLYESRILFCLLFPIISSMGPKLSAVVVFAGNFAPHALAIKDSSQPHHDPFSRVSVLSSIYSV
jgi:hypothetical protein